MPSDKIILILTLIATHYTLTAAQIRKHIFPIKPDPSDPQKTKDPDPDGRQTRRFLSDLLRINWISKTHMEVTNPLHPMTASVYYPAVAGCHALSEHTGDLKWLLTNCQRPANQHLRHFLALSELRIMIHAAVAKQDLVSIPHFFNEFDVVNQEAALHEPEKRYRLYTICTLKGAPRRLICCPDAAFQLKKATGARRAYYIEMETSNPLKAAAEKTKGYAALAKTNLFRRHFPDMDSFAVLVFAPNPGWRDGLRRVFAKKERPDLYRFVSLSELTADNFLFEPHFYSIDQGPLPLVNR